MSERDTVTGRFLKGENLRERLERNSRVDPNTGCRLWVKRCDEDGYGRTAVDGKTIQAHRAMWEAVHGPIPPGMRVCHHCDTPPCIELECLFLGTDADNVADRDAKGRQARGEKQGLSKLTEEDVRAIRRSQEGPSIVAKRFDITAPNVWFIRTRRTWAHVEDA